MFDEEKNWNDDQDAQILNKTAFENTLNESSSTNSRVVGKKSLLRTLQTLGSIPEWKSDKAQNSDSEAEAAPSPGKKKKKRKRRKQVEKSEEQRGGGGVQTVKKEKHVSKKKEGSKPGTLKTNSTSADKTKEKKITEIPQVDVNKAQNEQRLSRQQWKTKMRNKRRCKNKYRQDNPEENVNKPPTVDGQELKEEIQTDSRGNNSNFENIGPAEKQKKKDEQKALKRKNTDETDLFTPTSKKKQQEAEKKTKGANIKTSVSGHSADGSEQNSDGLQVKTTRTQQQFITKAQKPVLSKERILKRQKLQKILLSREKEEENIQAVEPEDEEKQVSQSSSDTLRSRMEQQLEAARFRFINELLYTTTSGEAKRMFRQDPQAFWVYHKGYTAQVQKWPSNPVDAIISYIQNRPTSRVVADFGCGDCKIARSVKNRVHSFDLAATCELATVCDMANVPLDDDSVDIAVFCLSLMGTNLADFLAEANRVLKMGGILKIAEVASRFDSEHSFITALARLGFKMTSKDTKNSHFYSFDFVKTGNASKNAKKIGLQLKPCVYKKR
ncbi:ribosomal RNA-processing protein 8 isoform X2 [Austrofundulus limnaeus]|uniref:Ribosomal RNA-processing protein 8 n=1 Tax=Austrofundulus limnaeus TaxID=52670 RepID=A0A2I4CL24_AUSLI|nr:PREDICTED: ribosomal RNA-processing protein 8 isoform X2 [Austrofundulus limnaeus]